MGNLEKMMGNAAGVSGPRRVAEAHLEWVCDWLYEQGVDVYLIRELADFDPADRPVEGPGWADWDGD